MGLHAIGPPNINGQWLLAPYQYTRFQRKRRNCPKKNFQNMCSGFFFLERNFILRIFLSGMSFSFLFPDFHFQNTIISFLDFFSRMYYFSILDFFVRNKILIFVSGFLFSELNNHFWIYFFGIYYFQFWIFISRIKGIFGN